MGEPSCGARPASARAALLVSVAALAALSGCGGDDKPARTVTVPGDQAIRIEGDEYSFDPSHVIVTGSPPQLRITLDNVGSLAHNVRVLDGERDLGGVRSFPSGEERSATVGVPPGKYRLVCTVGDHEALGMKGELEVR
jgi:plastocyanin